jgi:hypothetical protein
VEEVLIDYEEVININTLDANRMQEDFVSIKIGDVNGDVFNLRGNILGTRSADNLTLRIEDKVVEKGEIIQVPVEGVSSYGLHAFQVELNIEGLEYEGIDGGYLEINEDNIAAFDDVLRMVYVSVDEKPISGKLFTLTLKATRDGHLGDMISVSNGIINEVVFSQNQLGRLELNIGEPGSASALYQNEPNPFSDFTDIGFYLENSGQATLTIHNVEGKEIKVIEGNYTKGLNKIRIEKNQIPIQGVLYYTLRNGEFFVTRKMILIE